LGEAIPAFRCKSSFLNSFLQRHKTSFLRSLF